MWTGQDRERYKDDGRRYPSDLSETEWALIRPLVETYPTRTRDIREMVNGCLYLAAEGCRWRALPKEFGPSRSDPPEMGWTAPDGIDVPECGLLRPTQKEPSAMSITMIGLDTAKAVFHVHGVNETGKAEVRRKLRRGEVIGFFEAQPACTVVLEACGAAHHWGRVLMGLGHTVRLIAPEAVRPFVKPGRKNDAADAAALCEAARRPEVKFVPVKGLEQQGTLALHTARALLVKQQTMLANALRSLAAEFGLVAPLGFGKLGELMAQVEAEAEASVPEAARQALRALHGQFHAARDAAAALEAAVVAHARQDETARRLATIPGVGPITASLIAATVVDVGLFKSARHFAAWLGLVPRQHSTGGKARLGRITKAGNEQIRMLLVLGATSMARRAEGWNSAAGAWIRGVLARRPARLATVALANKMARIAWAVMAHKEDYRPFGRAAAAAVAA